MAEPGPTGELEPINPEEAEVILNEAIQPYTDNGWFVLDRSASTARLTKGPRNLDIRVDLLGQVEVTTSSLSASQESGRLVAWSLLLVSLLAALVVANILGLL